MKDGDALKWGPLALLLAVFGCRQEAQPVEVPLVEVQPVEEDAAPVSPQRLELKDVPLLDALGELSEALGQPVVLAGDGHELARSFHLSLVWSEDSPEGLEALLNLALEGSELKLRQTAAGWVFYRAVPHRSECVRSGASEPVQAEPLRGVTRISDTEFAVTAEARGALMKEGAIRARWVPQMSEGQVVGIRVFGVRPGSPLHQLGLQNGDRVEKVNHVVVTTFESAQAALEEVKRATTLTVQIVRRGTPLSLNYRLAASQD